MNNVIVTGASGMIGSALIKLLVNDDIEVTALVRPNSQKMNNLVKHSSLKLMECDTSDYLSIKDQLSGSYDTFFHFAWCGAYGAARNDLFLQNQNIKNALEAVELAHAVGCKTFVGAGTQAEFGRVEGLISDQLPKNPLTGYGIAKNTAGQMTRLLCEQYHMRHNWGRILSAYGPGDNTYTMVMSSIIGMCRNERLKFTRGDQIWDYIYSDDCARAFYLIGENGKHGKAYTIGSGESKCLREFIEIMRDRINPELELGIGEMDYYPNQVMMLLADISELTEDTGFKPSVEFEDGILKTIEWVKQEVKS